MKWLVAAGLLLALPLHAWGAPPSVRGSLYPDMGQYFIEIVFHFDGTAAISRHELVPERFEIVKLEKDAQPFEPSKVEVSSETESSIVVILSSSKLKGPCCCRVTIDLPEQSPLVLDTLCDVFAVHPDTEESGTKSFFKKYVAEAFRQGGDTYTLNQFKYERDFSDGKSSSSLAIAPSFKVPAFAVAPRLRVPAFAVEPSYEQSTVAYSVEGAGKTPTDKSSFGCNVSTFTWARNLRFGISSKYRHDHSSLHLAARDSVISSQNLTVEGRIRFDNFFDGVNRFDVSVFKGVDLGVGYAWYHSDTSEVWGTSAFERTTPFVNVRATWTFLFGFQFSYSRYWYWPSSIGGELTAFHSLRFRLLLRDALTEPGDKPAGKPYHPDLEFAYDAGKRLPLFAKEEKFSIGFTFNLYPW